ncbi:MAG TPA: glycosyltransferase family 87 protein [Ktedonobacteraceae bacterium]
MSVMQAPRLLDISETDCTTRFPWRRSLALTLLLAGSLATSAWLIARSPKQALTVEAGGLATIVSLAQPYLLCFLPYALACTLVLFARPANRRWRQVEIGLILGGALLLRAVLLPLPPNLSRDSWRYVWDARVFLHGYSPYVLAPAAKVLQPLQDFIYANSRFRNVPSLYPPGAQYIYLLSYLIVPGNLYALKGIFLLFDLASCVVLLKLLVRKGLDATWVLLYAWCPLPVVEFALQGHVDVLTITFTLLAALTADDNRWHGRVLTGFFVGMATLTKLYPIVMLVTVVRLRDWRRDCLLLLSCLLTIILGYLPFYIQGHGQIFGYFGTYVNEQGQNAGVVQQLIFQFDHARHLALATVIAHEHQVAFVLLVVVALLIFVLRQFQRISLEGGTLILFGLLLAVSSHVFPWYTATLLPWIALLFPARGARTRCASDIARGLALVVPWLFLLLSVAAYMLTTWPTYYLTIYWPLLALLALAAGLACTSVLAGLQRRRSGRVS